MTDRDIRLLWLYMAEMWATFTIPADDNTRTMRTQVWQDTLGDLDQQTIRAALVALSGQQYPPPVGAIRTKALELAEREMPAPDVDEAWRAVYENACGRLKPRDYPIWEHPAVEAAVATIGWDQIRYSETVGVERAHFLKVYAVTRERHARLRLQPAPAVLAFLDGRPAIKRAEDVPQLTGGAS